MECKFRGSKNQKMYQRNGKEFTEIYPVKWGGIKNEDIWNYESDW
jgi:hypothetical protein